MAMACPGGDYAYYLPQKLRDAAKRLREAEPAELCNWHKCKAVATTNRTDLGGTVTPLCEEHAAAGMRKGYWRPAPDTEPTAQEAVDAIVDAFRNFGASESHWYPRQVAEYIARDWKNWVTQRRDAK